MKVEQVFEATVIPDDVTLEEIIKMFDGARKGISIINKIKDKAQRKRHASQVFTNINKIRWMLQKLIKE